MSRPRSISLNVLVVLAITVATSTSASAHAWLKNDSPITQTEHALSEGGLFIYIMGARVIDCESVRDLTLLLTEGRDFVHSIHFLNCKTAQAGCDVHSHGAPNGLILVSRVPTLIVERETSAKEKVLADEFKSNPTTKEFVTLLFTALSGGSCSEYGTETKIKGEIAAEIKGELLVFPNPELKGNTLEGFGAAAKLFGDDTQMFSNGGVLSAE
jgi:hypothetical protein